MKVMRKIVIIAGTLVFLGSVIYLGLNAPLGPPLPTAPPTARQTQEIPPTSTAEHSGAAVTAPPGGAPGQAQGRCGQSGVRSVLVLGENLPETPGRGADAIRLARLDYDQQRLDVLALPPDLWVQTPALAGAQLQATTLTHAYYAARQSTPGSERAKMIAATRLFAQMLADNFAWQPNSYLTLKQPAFSDLVDAMGGLKINLPEALDGSAEGYGIFPAGEQVLSGQRVLDYLRALRPAGDPNPGEWERMARQDRVLQALYAQAASPATIGRIPGLIQQFHQDVVTDLSVKELYAMACLLGDERVVLSLHEVGPELLSPGEGGALLPKKDEVARLLAGYAGR